jgi:hypothetical protein
VQPAQPQHLPRCSLIIQCTRERPRLQGALSYLTTSQAAGHRGCTAVIATTTTTTLFSACPRTFSPRLATSVGAATLITCPRPLIAAAIVLRGRSQARAKAAGASPRLPPLAEPFV